MDSTAEWLKGPRDSSANEELFTLVENLYFFLTQTFTPSAVAMSLTPGGIKVCKNNIDCCISFLVVLYILRQLLIHPNRTYNCYILIEGSSTCCGMEGHGDIEHSGWIGHNTSRPSLPTSEPTCYQGFLQ